MGKGTRSGEDFQETAWQGRKKADIKMGRYGPGLANLATAIEAGPCFACARDAQEGKA